MNTTDGGSIEFGANITLTTSRSFDLSDIKIFGNANRLYMGGNQITITSKDCYFDNVVFDNVGSSAVTPLKFTYASVVSLSFKFLQCRFQGILQSIRQTERERV